MASAGIYDLGWSTDVPPGRGQQCLARSAPTGSLID